ncbi:MAG: DUF2189 domain-containing protein [Rhodocyclales bacterium]|nr:DUF2189 domain-containing protein [Rhodocyclales bacterium]
MDSPFNRMEHHFALPEVAHVPLLRPFEWVGLGWQDLRRSPLASLAYGLIIAALGALILTSAADRPYLFTALISGFLLVGPMLAVGLYEVSRRHAAGEDATFRQSLEGWRRNFSSVGLFGILLAVIALGWERLSAIIFALLYGGAVPDLSRFMQEIFFSGDYPRLVTVYVLAGVALAALVFAMSVVSIPMMMDRGTDMATAMVTSFKAVAVNPAPMVLWAAVIVSLAAAGFATFLVGMVFIMPILGHATWHAYRELVK